MSDTVARTDAHPDPQPADPDDLDPSAPTAEPGRPARRSWAPGLFRAAWRWHFYASALVIPIMLMLAVTGLIWLFRWQIDPAMHPGLLTVDQPRGVGAVAYAEQEAAVLAAHPDATITAVQQGHDERATFFTVSLGGGEDAVTRNVYVDQYSGRVLGDLDPAGLLSSIAVEMHGMIVFGGLADLELFHDPIVGEMLTLGGAGDRIIELAACWTVVMAITGYILYVQGARARARRLAKGLAAARMRHRHATYGALIGVPLLLLVITGLPWTGLWGSKVQAWATGQGLSLWGEDPGAESTLGARLEEIGSSSAPAPWAAGAAPVPSSGTGTGTGTGTGDTAAEDTDGHAGHGGHSGAGAQPGRIDVDRAIATAAGTGLPGPYYVTYPDGETGVFSVLGDQWHDKANPAFEDVTQERTVHVDQYSGAVAGQYGYDEYSVAAKVVSQGIALHEGRRLGSFNLVATTAFCLGVIFLCITGPLMWWKRRPRGGGLAAPRGRMPLRRSPLVVAVVVVLAVLLPLFGVTLLIALLVDQFLIRRVPALSRVFDPA